MHLRNSEDPAEAGLPVRYNTHVLVRADGLRIPQPDWEWADTDNEQLLWGAEGRLYRAQHVNRDSPMEPRGLHDFRGIRFRAVRAPYDDRR